MHKGTHLPSHWLEKPSYQTLHMRLWRFRGRASAHLCESDCGAQARDWSYDYSDPDELIEDGKRYSVDLTKYLALCRSCHRKLDARTHCFKGHEYTEENTVIDRGTGRRRCRICKNRSHRDWKLANA